MFKIQDPKTHTPFGGIYPFRASTIRKLALWDFCLLTAIELSPTGYVAFLGTLIKTTADKSSKKSKQSKSFDYNKLAITDAFSSLDSKQINAVCNILISTFSFTK